MPRRLLHSTGCLFLLTWASSHPAAAQSLSLGDGQLLPVVRYDVQIVVHHPVVETTITQEFDNPHPSNLEAFFTYAVPAGATVTELALWVKDQRRPARLLERGVAREIYEGIVREQRDPALLEKVNSNSFRIRIFPVLARARTRIELRLAQTVESATGTYRLSLPRPPGETVHALRLGAALHLPEGARQVRLEGLAGVLRQQAGVWTLAAPAAPRSFERDLRFLYELPAGERVSLVTQQVGAERLFVAELPVSPAARRPQAMALLVDCSRSMEASLPAARGLGRALLRQLSEEDRLAIVPFDLLPRLPVELRPLQADRRHRLAGVLNDLRAARGGAFLPALRAARAAGARHLVLVSDGGAPHQAAELERMMAELDGDPVQVSTIMVSGAQNQEQLAAISSHSAGVHAELGDGAVDRLVLRLLEARVRPSLSLPEGGQAMVIRESPGRLLVAGSLPQDSTAVRIQLHTGEARWLSLAGARPSRAVSAIYGEAAIEKQMQRIRLLGETPELRAEVIRLSLRHGVVSEYTALLATETDADYERPTSGQPWQRRLPGAAEDLPPTGFQSTPEPHELALLALGLLLLRAMRRRRASGGPAGA